MKWYPEQKRTVITIANTNLEEVYLLWKEHHYTGNKKSPDYEGLTNCFINAFVVEGQAVVVVSGFGQTV